MNCKQQEVEGKIAEGIAQKKPAVETAGDLTIACYMNLF
jgi:hypothetical protein